MRYRALGLLLEDLDRVSGGIFHQHLPAAEVTRGHRFIGSSNIRVRSFADYKKQLRANGVILRPAERLEKIQRELDAHTKKGSYRVHADADLLKLVTYLNEFPSVIQGDFDPAFLNLPDEILVTVMRGHQKFSPSSTSPKTRRDWSAPGMNAS